MPTDFSISFLDHVAIHVADTDRSMEWYETVLGLKKYQLEKWGAFPIFMLSGKSGVAIFPADSNQPSADSNGIRIDHFAFNVTRENYEKAKARYMELGLEFEEQDHHYFDSIYTQDPDGHTVELTTIKVDEEGFYGT